MLYLFQNKCLQFLLNIVGEIKKKLLKQTGYD